GAEELVGDLDEQPGAVAGQRVGAYRAAMRQVGEDADAVRDDRMAFLVLDMRDKSDAARIVFVAWIIQTLCRRQYRTNHSPPFVDHGALRSQTTNAAYRRHTGVNPTCLRLGDRHTAVLSPGWHCRRPRANLVAASRSAPRESRAPPRRGTPEGPSRRPIEGRNSCGISIAWRRIAAIKAGPRRAIPASGGRSPLCCGRAAPRMAGLDR